MKIPDIRLCFGPLKIFTSVWFILEWKHEQADVEYNIYAGLVSNNHFIWKRAFLNDHHKNFPNQVDIFHIQAYMAKHQIRSKNYVLLILVVKDSFLQLRFYDRNYDRNYSVDEVATMYELIF